MGLLTLDKSFLMIQYICNLINDIIIIIAPNIFATAVFTVDLAKISLLLERTFESYEVFIEDGFVKSTREYHLINLHQEAEYLIMAGPHKFVPFFWVKLFTLYNTYKNLIENIHGSLNFSKEASCKKSELGYLFVDLLNKPEKLSILIPGFHHFIANLSFLEELLNELNMVFLKVKNVMVVRTPHTSLDILVLVVCERTEDLAKVKDYQLILNLRREVRELLHNFYPVALYNCVTVNFSTCSNVELVPFLKLDLETSNNRTCSKLSPVDFFLIHFVSIIILTILHKNDL